MLGIENFELFVIAGIFLIITPGPDSLYIIARSTSQGKLAGLISAYGICLGSFIHIIAAMIGLSAILASSAYVFTTLKYLGALYLIYLGVKMLLFNSNSSERNIKLLRSNSSRSLFYQGFITNILNPKVAIFFLAFLPQFVNPQASNPQLTFLFLGLTLITAGTIYNITLAIIAAKSLKTISRKSSKLIDKIAGVVITSLGIKLAFDRS